MDAHPSRILRLNRVPICLPDPPFSFQVGTKYDQFVTFSKEEQEEITRQVSRLQNAPVYRVRSTSLSLQSRRFARAMKAPLIFCSTSHSINVQKIFKIVLSKVSE